MKSAINTELFASMAKEANTSPLSGPPAWHIPLCQLLSGTLATSTHPSLKNVDVMGKRWWQQIKIMSQT